jgi:hypothetical protein
MAPTTRIRKRTSWDIPFRKIAPAQASAELKKSDIGFPKPHFYNLPYVFTSFWGGEQLYVLLAEYPVYLRLFPGPLARLCGGR